MTTNCTALNSTDDCSTTSAVDPGRGSTAMETWTENLDNLDTTKRMGPVYTKPPALVEPSASVTENCSLAGDIGNLHLLIKRLLIKLWDAPLSINTLQRRQCVGGAVTY